MSKILFIVPPNITFNHFTNPSFNERIVNKESGNYGSVITDMPLGILSMSAYLKKYSNIETKLLDFNIILNKLENFKYSSFTSMFLDFISKYNEYNPDIISISALFTLAYQSMLDIAEVCRIIFPKVIIVVGGGIPTNMYEEILKTDTSINALCYGEGEIPLKNLILSENKIQYFESDPSWITRTKVENNKLFKYTFIENLDEIPFLDYNILNLDDYKLNPSITAYASIENKQNIHVMTSRGCVHYCCFCASHTVHGRKMRYYSIERVKEDFIKLKEKYGMKTVVFQDDHLMSDKERFYKIIDIIKELQLKVVFQNALAMYALDRKMLETLKDAGVEQISLSAESGNNKVLKYIMHKPINTSIIERVTNDCRELKIYTNMAILVGLPGETKEDIEISRNFFKTIPANWFLIFCATPLVGSEMYEICKRENYLKDNYIGNDYKKCVINTKDFSSEYIEEKVYLLNLELNFINNADFRLKNYKSALRGFEHTISVKNDHVIAYYYAAKCYKELGNLEKEVEYMTIVKTLSKDPLWKKYLEYFNIIL